MLAREHYATHGPDQASDEALLSLAIGTGVSGRPSALIARDLLDRFGGLEAVSRASVHSLTLVQGLGMARAVRLHASLSLARRSARRDGPPPPTVLSPNDAWRHFAPLLADRAEEELHGLYLGARGRVLMHRCLTRGSDRHTVVDPRQVYRPAIELGAVSVIVAHNHPSGDFSPSQPDREVTRRLANAGRVLGVALLDHIVLSSEGFTSLAESGELPSWTSEPRGWTD